MQNNFPTMQTVRALSKFLIEAWHNSTCPENECIECKYIELCTKIEELEKMVSK